MWDKKGCVELVGAALCLGPRGWEKCHTREALTAFAVASENLVCLGALFRHAANQAMATACFYELALRQRV